MKGYKILKDLVSFNTIKDLENKEIINYIEKYLKNLGFKTEHKGKYLIMSIGNNYKIGFLGHTDTVEYIDGWNTNPFELTKMDNRLYGLGSCDMKGGIAALLDAVSKIDFTKLKYLFMEWFNKIPVDNEVMYQSMIEELNNKIGDKEKKIYDLIKLSYNKV